MKYFFPTTTLNFDGILSSQLISPAGMYRADTLWWNRFETVLGQRKDSIILYNQLPLWEIDDSERDNYPLVVELDGTVLPEDTQEIVLEKPLKAVFVMSSIEFSALDFERRSVRFLFRSKAEKDRMLVKVLTSVAECKVVNMMRIDLADVFAVMPKKKKAVSLKNVTQQLTGRLEGISDVDVLEYPKSLVEEERVHGAELGYRVGRYVKSLRSGAFVDTFRRPLSFMDWKNEVLSEPFAAFLNYLCLRALQPWDPNRSAMVAFCRDRWADCFKGKRDSGKIIVEGSDLHASLQNIARHWASPEVPYRISREENPYMQAFAAFLECGTQAGKYPRFVREPVFRSPEYLLALYGALVGYTSFSRILLDNKMYLSQQPKKITKEALKSKGVRGKGLQKGCIIASPEPKREVADLPLFNQEKCLHDDQIQGELKGLLVCDKDLCAEIKKQFSDFGETRIQNLTKAVTTFCNKYTTPEGFYGKHPEKYKKENPDLIDHLLCCFRSELTPEIKFEWASEKEEVRFVDFLRKRYGCKRRTQTA